MTLKQRIFLISAICIMTSGLLVSYKSFELNKKFSLQSENEKSREVSQWVAQMIEQKVTHLESSVSYLDASTVETLKRMGARYFAYAYPKNDKWKIKWKVLGDLDRKGILSEVNQISFKSLSSTKRTWDFNKDSAPILISPVELSGSHQLKNGFLIFGLNEEFFSFIGGVDAGISVVSLDQKKLFVKKESSFKSILTALKEKADSISIDGEDQLFTQYFAKPSQLYVTRAQALPALTYFGSPLFSYLLLGLTLSLLLLLVVLQRFILATERVIADETEVSLSPSRPSLLSTLTNATTKVGESLKRSRVSTEVERPTVERELSSENIQDFAGFLDDIISLERSRLQKFGVTIQTQVEEDVQISCIPQHLTDFLRRLMENSIQVLRSEQDKQIQIQVVNQSSGYQLIYLDGRQNQFPDGNVDSVFLQDESSLENINGLVSYGRWLFADSLTVAKQGFCISIDLPEALAQAEDVEPKIEALFESETMDRIEIREEDTIDLQFEKVETNKPQIEEPKADLEDSFSTKSIEDIVSSFQMKDFSFDSEEQEVEASAPEVAPEEEVDKKGFFEFDTGDFKIKIRSPKNKKDTDVSR